MTEEAEKETKAEEDGFVNFEVTMKGTIRIKVPTGKLDEVLDLGEKAPIQLSDLPSEMQAEFEEQLFKEGPDFDYEITDIY